MSENSKPTLVDEIAALARKNKTRHYEEIITKIRSMCSTTHKYTHVSYGDDYVMNYAMATITKEQLEADGFTVDMKQTEGTNKSGVKNDNDGTFTLTISGWV